MSVPPSFSDLGKAARDIFSKGFSKCLQLHVSVPLVENEVFALSLVWL